MKLIIRQIVLIFSLPNQTKLSMKRILFLLLLGSFSSLVAAASNEVKELSNNPDPVKGQKASTSSSFELSKGYFSLFDLLKMPSMTTSTDTLSTGNSKGNASSGLNVQTKFKVQTK
jgi:hypothetical protein